MIFFFIYLFAFQVSIFLFCLSTSEQTAFKEQENK